MNELSHLSALQTRRFNEAARLAKSSLGEKEIREVWLAQIDNEIDAEIMFLERKGISVPAYLLPLDPSETPDTVEDILRDL